MPGSGGSQTFEVLPTPMPEAVVGRIGDLESDLGGALDRLAQAAELLTDIIREVEENPDAPVADIEPALGTLGLIIFKTVDESDSDAPAVNIPPCNSAEAQANPGLCL